MNPPRISARDAKLDPSINWVAVANRLRRMGDRIGARECLRLARLFRLHGRPACAPRLP